MPAILAAPPTRRKRLGLRGMQPRAPIATDLVLLGAGHAHVEVLRRFAMRPEPGVRLTLIGREPETPYTGMLPGLIRGDYTFDAGAYRPGAARRQRRRAADPGRGDGHRPGGAPRRGDRAARRAVRPAVDRCRRRAGDAARRGGRGAGQADRAVPGTAVGAGGDAAARRAHRRGRRRRRRDGTGAGPGAALPRAGADRAGVRYARAAGERAVLCAAASRAPRWSMPAWNWPAACGPAPGPTAGWRCPTAASWRSATALWATGVVGPAFLAASGLACDAAGCVQGGCDAAQRQPWLRLRRRRLRRHRGQSAAEVRRLGGARRRAAGGQSASRGARAGAAPLAAAVGRAGDPRPRRRARAGVAQRRRGGRPAGLALEGLDRSALDADVPGADGADGRADDPMRCGGCGAKVGAEVLAGALAACLACPAPMC